MEHDFLDFGYLWAVYTRSSTTSILRQAPIKEQSVSQQREMNEFRRNQSDGSYYRYNQRNWYYILRSIIRENVRYLNVIAYFYVEYLLFYYLHSLSLRYTLTLFYFIFLCEFLVMPFHFQAIYIYYVDLV